MTPTRRETISKIREKYPQYKDIPDDQLASSLSAKYPQYKASLEYDPEGAYERLQGRMAAQNAPKYQGPEITITGDLPKDDYTPEQMERDIKMVNRRMLEEEQSKLAKENEKLDDLANTGKLESAATAIVNSPLSIGLLGSDLFGAALNKVGGKDPSIQRMLQMHAKQRQIGDEQIQGRLAANPITSAIAGAGGEAMMMGGPGGIVRNLMNRSYKEAGKQYLKTAPVNVAVGEGTRRVLGDETSTGEVLMDLATAGFGGRNKPLENALGDTLEKGVDTASKPIVGTARVVQAVPRKGVETFKSVKRSTQKVSGGVKETLQNLFDAPENKLLAKAIVPNVSKGARFGELAERYMPAVTKAADEAGIELTNLRGLMEANDLALKKTWKQIEDSLGAAEQGGLRIDTDDIAEEMIEAGMNKKLLREAANNPALQKKLEAAKLKAESYRGGMSPTEAEDILQTANDNLETVYNQFQRSGGKLSLAALTKSDPELAAELALAQGLRKKLDAITDGLGPKYSELKKTYGALSSLKSDLARSIGVDERQRLMGLDRLSIAQVLPEVLKNPITGIPKLAIQATGSKILKEMDSKDEMVRRAFEKYRGKVKAPAPEVSDLEKKLKLEEALKKLQAEQEKTKPVVESQPQYSETYY